MEQTRLLIAAALCAILCAIYGIDATWYLKTFYGIVEVICLVCAFILSMFNFKDEQTINRDSVYQCSISKKRN